MIASRFFPRRVPLRVVAFPPNPLLRLKSPLFSFPQERAAPSRRASLPRRRFREYPRALLDTARTCRALNVWRRPCPRKGARRIGRRPRSRCSLGHKHRPSGSRFWISPTGFSTSLLTYDSKHSTHVKCASAHEMPSAAGASQKHIVHVCEEGGGRAEVSAWTRRRRPGEGRASARSGAEVPNAFRRETEGCLQSRPPRGETRAGRDTRARWRLARVGSRTFSSDAAMPGASPAPRALACGALRRRRRGGPKAQQRFARRTSSANAGFKRDGRRVDAVNMAAAHAFCSQSETF
jgi:hypothetical protein